MSNQEIAPKLHWWQRKASIIAFAIIGTLVLITVLSFVAHIYRWDVTTATTTEVTQSPQIKVTTTETGKTLLDWLQLVGVLAIPIVVAIGTAVFTIRQTRISEANRQQQHDTEMQITEVQQQEELLRTYLDKISDLLLDKELRTNQTIQSVVRARTLAALHMLKTERKAIVLRFLHDSDLLQYVKGFLHSLDFRNINLSSIDLSGADLSGADLSRANLIATDLRDANLSGANLSTAALGYTKLSGANLSRANLDQAFLLEADLSEADLSYVKLSQASLFEANLHHANLSGANLHHANLSQANLSQANLFEANLFEADLRDANLSGANLKRANLSQANLFEADLSGADLIRTDLRDADLHKADLRGANLLKANLSGADLRHARITLKQLEVARNITPEQFAQISQLEPAATQEVNTEQASTTPVQPEIQPYQTIQEEAEQQEHKLPKQDTEAAH